MTPLHLGRCAVTLLKLVTTAPDQKGSWLPAAGAAAGAAAPLASLTQYLTKQLPKHRDFAKHFDTLPIDSPTNIFEGGIAQPLDVVVDTKKPLNMVQEFMDHYIHRSKKKFDSDFGYGITMGGGSPLRHAGVVTSPGRITWGGVNESALPGARDISNMTDKSVWKRLNRYAQPVEDQSWTDKEPGILFGPKKEFSSNETSRAARTLLGSAEKAYPSSQASRSFFSRILMPSLFRSKASDKPLSEAAHCSGSVATMLNGAGRTGPWQRQNMFPSDIPLDTENWVPKALIGAPEGRLAAGTISEAVARSQMKRHYLSNLSSAARRRSVVGLLGAALTGGVGYGMGSLADKMTE